MIGRAEAQSFINLYVGSNSANQTTNFTSGTNSYSNAYVGYSDPLNTNLVTNNTLVISNSGTVLNFSGVRVAVENLSNL